MRDGALSDFPTTEKTVTRRITAFILVVGALHVIPIVQEMRGPRQTTWPVMAWGMYRYAHRPPVEITEARVSVETTGGDRRVLEPGDLGLKSYGFDRLYVGPLARGDSAAARVLADRLASASGPPAGDIEAILLRSIRYRLTGSGIAADTTFERFPYARP